MAVTLDATVGGESANSYISLEDAETYFEERMPAAANWSDSVTDENKNKALITATRLLDQMVVWGGEIASDDQALLWPRGYLEDAAGRDIENDEIPNEVGYAVCEFADVLLATDKTDDSTTAGIEDLKVGDIGIKFNVGSPPERRVLPEIVWEYIRRWCKSRMDGAGGSSKIKRA